MIKDINDMTRKELEDLKVLQWDEPYEIDSLILLPTRKLCGSGYRLYDIIVCQNETAIGKIGLYDTHSIILNTNSREESIGIDCLKGSGLMRIFLPKGYWIKHWCHQTSKMNKETFKEPAK